MDYLVLTIPLFFLVKHLGQRSESKKDRKILSYVYAILALIVVVVILYLLLKSGIISFFWGDSCLDRLPDGTCIDWDWSPY